MADFGHRYEFADDDDHGEHVLSDCDQSFDSEDGDFDDIYDHFIEADSSLWFPLARLYLYNSMY